jgi:hypothetical protein
LIFDPAYPYINHHKYKHNQDWKPFYGNVKEAMPTNAPPARGKAVALQCYVDSDHVGNLLTRRSRTGYVQMANMAIINWHSKKQGSVEGSSFGRKFVAAKAATEANLELTCIQALDDGCSN